MMFPHCWPRRLIIVPWDEKLPQMPISQSSPVRFWQNWNVHGDVPES